MRHHNETFIGGAWSPPVGKEIRELVNPATEEVFATVRHGNGIDVDRAVSSARQAFASFSTTSKAERIALLRRILEELEAREQAFTDAAVNELGNPVSDKFNFTASLASVQHAISTLSNYEFETSVAGHTVRREAIGVCGLITAWNRPLQLPCTKVVFALAAGCTVVLKPSEFTPVSALLLAEALEAAGVPKGVFNLVIGDGLTVGKAIVEHLAIDMISFTGSTRAGTSISQGAAHTIKRVGLELGGKSANLILPDADLRAAVAWNVTRGFGNAGQSCHAPTRVLVHRDQLRKVEDLFKEEVAKVVVGDPADPSTMVGPVVNEAQFSMVQTYIRLGLESGCRLVCGGPGRPEGLDKGYYIRPTVFTDVKPDDRISQEEIFGPVLAIIPYHNVDEAIGIANGTLYGLAAYLFTGNTRDAGDIGRQLRAGRVFLNGAAANPSLPMGGYKRSGNGREMGVWGLEEYLEVKALVGFGVEEVPSE
ncbi:MULTISPECIES: aldehyde dehydrogenase family protein [unclassified Mesorhizobium]|uniref:aldehyde dehydrogenase family protein n=1 Tax=unclassified Mesorhizobium TaxID=325217 RepID=UPI000FDB7142|nr:MULTISPECIES: aldehyde dehydrogenase family protein [unclassified Mesorhizobium]TGR18797.1 aldehyde dehydrogenase family protein [Mesorhizobium sp. M8A.F.Ca.ET.197.01.1.1]TGR37061.1 aldehyde dehydrogenase family protein [bacterium M00.F.Ca.ET.199.01.1.1]TGR41601.1 aldehyde dehydrogenase family protein [Mesorhizobium sp. M8A.F.Ca.ET.198.01.1.1]TGV85312.1 aldehyde dehydrogenase family protein [Mesorhizobium sp. M00.F.Ca.ET.149.01.1.1]